MWNSEFPKGHGRFEYMYQLTVCLSAFCIGLSFLRFLIADLPAPVLAQQVLAVGILLAQMQPF